jgi:hypothetical protein
MKPIKILNDLIYQQELKRSPLPAFAVVKPAFKQTSANEVTKSICAFIEALGGRADRINVQGQWNVKLDRFTKSHTRKGVADIICCIRGRYVAIEVKFGKDRQSEHQKIYEQAVVDASGYYVIAKDFDSFYNWYKSKDKTS